MPAEIIARHRIRRATLADLPPLSPGQRFPFELAKTDGLPPEFADYHAGACALVRGEPAYAVQFWQRLLTLPAAERKFKSTWAAFMLGRTAPNDDEARVYFQKTRHLARDGFADSLGLAAASLGWEAKTWLDAGDFPRAADLYLAQFATDDPTAANSLRFLATRVLARDDPALLTTFARDPRLRDLITALLLCQREEEIFPQFTSGVPNIHAGATARWLAELEHASVNDAPQAARLALAAYRAGQFDAAARWLKLAAPDDDLALWLRAKLALRAGDSDTAARNLATLVHRSAALADFRVFEDPDYEPVSASQHLRAELGALKLARRDYTEALELLLQSSYWEDAAYIAERVLTLDELKKFVDDQPRDRRALDKPDNERFMRSPQDLRHLLARRLTRHNRLDEARAYFPEKLAPTLDRYTALLRAGHDVAQPAAVRAAALMDAARLLRAEGMELRGAELAPDYAISAGNYENGLGLAAREQLSPWLRASSDEHARASAPDATPAQRFHYRSTAADFAWEAIALMPDESEVTARALVEAGGWLKARDPRAANRFYQTLVRRCGTTTLGRTAERAHWFPRAPL